MVSENETIWWVKAIQYSLDPTMISVTKICMQAIFHLVNANINKKIPSCALFRDKWGWNLGHILKINVSLYLKLSRNKQSWYFRRLT